MAAEGEVRSEVQCSNDRLPSPVGLSHGRLSTGMVPIASDVTRLHRIISARIRFFALGASKHNLQM